MAIYEIFIFAEIFFGDLKRCIFKAVSDYSFEKREDHGNNAATLWAAWQHKQNL